MFQLAKPLFLITETPLHAGSGDSLGVVDMPIQRERHTSFPKIEASSLKGALREIFEELADKQENFEAKVKMHVNIHKAFGYDDAFERGSKTDDQIKKLATEEERTQATEKSKLIQAIKASFSNKDYSGSLAFSDSRLLLFPVKSMKGVFAWITCERVLRQFEKDMNIAYTTEKKSFTIAGIANPNEGECFVLGNSSELEISKSNIVLEEYAFVRRETTIDISVNKESRSLQDWLSDKLFTGQTYWKEKAKNSIVILSNDDFKDFVNLSTEVITRTKIDNNTGTVASGALFTEEYLPSESVLYSLVMASPEFSKEETKNTAENNMEFFEKIPEIFQLGGNATLGKGVMRTVFEKSKSKGNE